MRAFEVQGVDAELPAELARLRPSWMLVYATEEMAPSAPLRQLAQCHPDVPLFGATSFQGVFTPSGFSRGMAVLVGEPGDGLRAHSAASTCGESDARQCARRAAGEVAHALGGPPRVILMHATPGHEEAILAGVRDALGQDVPVYGGSAADDSVAGRWGVFDGGRVIREGFVLAGFDAAQGVRGAFLAGYLPTGHGGRVTRAEGRVVHEIDNRPAAEVHDEWSGGRIRDVIASGGGTVLGATTMAPVARVVGETLGMPRRLISHPHEVHSDGALAFFSEFERGDEITLMTCTDEQLITRMGRTATRALGGSKARLRGGLFVYCGGSLGEILPRAAEISEQFAATVGPVPFVGVATFGEQGCFFERRQSRHGNLMCSTVLFE